VILSYSLSSQSSIAKNDHKTPPLKQRLAAIKRLSQAGHNIGLHLDPIILTAQFTEEYSQLIHEINQSISWESISYISLGVVRFTKDVFRQVQMNFPEAEFLQGNFKKAADQKVRYIRPLRLWILQKVKTLLIAAGADIKQIYFCMEDEDNDKN
jgi:spore photoproduct lyase